LKHYMTAIGLRQTAIMPMILCMQAKNPGKARPLPAPSIRRTRLFFRLLIVRFPETVYLPRRDLPATRRIIWLVPV
jgi:hypothetical protein